jgi:diaminohydroxyphosphoribosylaminopyrimidine deaminase/5-amino-6-(5-phosphoribosylamino)uracil reductase
MEQDKIFMQKAIELANKGRGRTSPNPMSGAVIVKDGEIVGEGFYSQSGTQHAEYYALEAAGEKANGATLYVVVEPCSTKGRYTSSFEYIKEKGIKRIVVAMEDPNNTVKGKGLKALLDSNMEVTLGVEEDSAKKLNETLFKYYAIRLPYVNMISAMTLDGKIATILGDREWIIGNESRNYLHELRATYDAILVGANTIIRDNPQLSCRVLGGRDPIKVVVDTYAKTPINSKIFIKNTRDDHKPNVIIAVSRHATEERIKALNAAGAEVIICSDEKSENPYERVNLKKLIYCLGKKGITSLLVESGGNLNAAAIEDGIVDKMTVFITPKIVGGKDAITPVEGSGISLMSEAIELKNVTYQKLGNDLLSEGYFSG